MFADLRNNWARARQKGLKYSVQFVAEQYGPSMAYPIARLRYHWRMWTNRPYFGLFYAAAQGVAAGVHSRERCQARESYMRGLVRHGANSSNEFRILEIGAWAGWSAIVWAKAMEDFQLKNGSVICVDPWKSYFDLKVNKALVYRTMEAATKKDAIIRLFHHNVRTAGYAESVRAFRGTSDECLPMLRDGSFNIVFIDGDHSYPAVKRDLENAGRLLRDGGILCGDDLDLQLSDLDEGHLRRQLSFDYSLDPKTGQHYHPGVTLAVWEFFGRKVSLWGALWAMQKAGDGWKPLELPKV